MPIKLTANINNQIEEISQQIENILGKEEGMQNKNNVSYFQSTEHNFDAMQNLNMNESKKELERTVEKNKIDINDFSITDAKDYLGCIGNQCKIIENHQNENMDFRENVMLNKNFMDTNINNDINNDINNNNDRENKEKNNNLNNLIPNLDFIITFIYIFLISVLLISSVLNKNNNLVYILLLTLVFIFYKIYFVK